MTGKVHMKPKRTFGLSLAILASIFIFSVLPLMQVGVVLLLDARIQQATADLQLGTQAPLAVGGNFTGVSTAALAAQTSMGVGFLVIAIFAWVGRPPFIRWVMMAAVLALTAIQGVITLITLFTPPDVSAGIDSGNAVAQPLLWLRLALILFVPLYVLWYMNRAPARAFYRGYYLPEAAAPGE
jgi:membrane protease YdiL (CAAX protease family)